MEIGMNGAGWVAMRWASLLTLTFMACPPDLHAESLPVVSVRLSTPQILSEASPNKSAKSACADCGTQLRMTTSFMIKDEWKVFGPEAEDQGEKHRPLKIFLQDTPGYELKSVQWPNDLAPTVTSVEKSVSKEDQNRSAVAADVGNQPSQKDLAGADSKAHMDDAHIIKTPRDLSGNFDAVLVVDRLKVVPAASDSESGKAERPASSEPRGTTKQTDSGQEVALNNTEVLTGASEAPPYGEAQKGIGTVRATWTACRLQECIPGEATLLFTLPGGPSP